MKANVGQPDSEHLILVQARDVNELDFLSHFGPKQRHVDAIVSPSEPEIKI
jgi:hypothetical protein